MYKVFINDRPIFFCKEAEVTNVQTEISSVKIDQQLSSSDILNKINDLTSSPPLFLLCKKPKKTFKKTFKNHKKIIAAGGIVKNTQGKLLFIERLGKWDLPKGKVEKNENIEAAAVREIEEECGISNPILGELITKTLHTYHMRNKNYIKTTYWYSIEYKGKEKLAPQAEEDITKAIWVNPKKLKKQLKNTYGSILDVIDNYKR
ncbi:MAG: 8-oxo-dGTP pyrophosphatase MutT (NUDIX family) [Flavobacteriales bacterium]|jgi:8-oxo-dGTP pyrophosphatase MutT (NUDIX family)